MKLTKCEKCEKMNKCIFDIPNGRLCKECYRKEKEKLNPQELDRQDLNRTLIIHGGLIALNKLN